MGDRGVVSRNYSDFTNFIVGIFSLRPTILSSSSNPSFNFGLGFLDRFTRLRFVFYR